MGDVQMKKKYKCKTCEQQVEGERYHAGFSDIGFLYCNKDSTVIIFNAYDSTFEKLVGDILPWTLVEENDRVKMELIERNLINCPCGGKFYFDNSLICPICGGEFSEPMAKNIYVFVLDQEIDGEKQNVWKKA